MKKKRLIILLSILVVVAIIGCFTFLYRAAAAEKDAFYKKYITGNEVAERLSRLPELIELGSESKPGYTIYFQDYSLTLPGYDDADIKNTYNSDNSSVYFIDDETCINFMKCYKDNILYNPPTLPSLIKKTVGREINTVYDYWEASFYCTPDEFSMFDIEINKGVYMLLETKYYNYDPYQFDNGVIKGFICSDYATVLFSSCDAPDSCYVIYFASFSPEEIKEILSTITFGGSKANQ